MLLLFALSILPKQLLHDVITGHKHTDSKFQDQTNYQASKNSFQCNWHHQIVESPFTDQPDFELQQPVISYSSYINHYTLSYHSADHLFSSLRGPPCRL